MKKNCTTTITILVPCLPSPLSFSNTIFTHCQPKFPTLDFVLVQVVSCNWHVNLHSHYPKRLRHSVFKNTPHFMLTFVFTLSNPRSKYKVTGI